MKKIICAFIVIAIFMMAIPATAQISYGLKTGVNLNKANTDGLVDNFKSQNASGFFIGPMAEIYLPLGLSLDGAFLYSKRSLKFEYQDYSGLKGDLTSKQHAFEIPVNLKYNFGLGDFFGIFVATGPDFIFNLKSGNLSKQLVHLADPDAEFNSGNKVKKAELAWNVGVGVKLIHLLQVGLNYNIPLSNNLNTSVNNLGVISDNGNFKSKNRTWQISFAIIL